VITPPVPHRLTRRQVLRAAGTVVAAPLGVLGRPRPARARPAALKICQWMHFVPAFDEWFDQRFAREWGERNGIRVTVEHLSLGDLRGRAALEAAARRGHDLFGFLQPPAAHEADAVPLNDVVAECERRYGKLVGLAHRATFNPRSRRYFALCDAWAPAPLHYRGDWWDDVGVRPESWEQVREGARKVRARHGAPAGFGLAPEPDTNMTLRGLLWSYGASEQDEAGAVTINSRATVEALKLMAAVYRESMTSEVFSWDPASNNRFYVYGHGSIIQNAISALRTAERQNPDVARRTALAPAAAGPQGRLACTNVVHSYVVWRFAENADAAQRFLVDLVGAADEAFRASQFYNFPAFSRAVPDLRARLTADRQNPRSYPLLVDAEQWSAAPGHPGYATAAVDEVLHRSVIPHMFARVARGEQSAEASARQAETEMKRIFDRWGRSARP
jgi:multiple sugar transport system substrate-binding protein